jgi:RES domain-containing protein
MNLKPNPCYDEFVKKVAEMGRSAAPWMGTTFRSAELKYAKARKILDGKGSVIAGGRWNPPDAFRTIYSSLRPGTAVEEAYALAAQFGLGTTDLRPRLTVGLQWKLRKALDLTCPDLAPWIDLASWLKEDFSTINRQGFETFAQAFGRACHASAITGFLCPSAAVPGGVNLVVFRDHARPPAAARVLGKDELRKFLK